MPTKARSRRQAGRQDGCTVADLARTLERFAPARLAADWDNVGLIAGATDWTVRNATFSIDLTDAVAIEALANRSDAIVAYHPPIFKGIRRITADADSPTRLLPELLAARVSILAVHTALDAAPGGTNDALLDAFQIRDRRPLTAIQRTGALIKLAVYVPTGEVADLRAALARAGAGHIGSYSECSFEVAGRGTFRGDESTHPTIGKPGVLESVAESRLEMILPVGRVDDVVRALYAAHSYEEPAFDLYPITTIDERGAAGWGRVGTLRKPTTGVELARQLAKSASMNLAAVVGDLDRKFQRVIAAAGSFGVAQFQDPDALVITGEFKHHEALTLLKRGVSALVLGHDESERPGLRALCRRVQSALPQLQCEIAQSDRSPFRRLQIARRAQ